MIRPLLNNLIQRFGFLRKLKRRLRPPKMWPPPGHFYSPLVDPRKLGLQAESLFDNSRKSFPGIDLREAAQCALLEELVEFYQDQLFPEENTGPARYYFRNGYYSYGDGLMLHAMIRRFAPKRIVEVGSGFSSAVMLETNERFFDGRISLTFIEPNPERLSGLMKTGDRERVNLIAQDVQDVDPACFTSLEAGDILFIDSSHVSKTGSDVNFLYLEVLPLLKPDVLIHIHDIFSNFEYPREWVAAENSYFGFNECYLLRAFLMFNSQFEIVMFTPWMEHHHRAWFEKNMPLSLKDPGGNLWLRRKA
jgi:predicted O-methyltransferase YrrM